MKKWQIHYARSRFDMPQTVFILADRTEIEVKIDDVVEVRLLMDIDWTEITYWRVK